MIFKNLFKNAETKVKNKTVKVTSDGNRLNYNGTLGSYDDKKNVIELVELAPKRKQDNSNKAYERFNKFYAKLVYLHEKRHAQNKKYIRDIKKFSKDLQFVLNMHDEMSCYLAEVLEIRNIFRKTGEIPLLPNRYYHQYIDFLLKGPALDEVPSQKEMVNIFNATASRIDFEYYAKSYVLYKGKERNKFPKDTSYTFDEILKEFYTFKTDSGRSFNMLNLLDSKYRSNFFNIFTQLTINEFEKQPATYWKHLTTTR